jgi:hypothetical protein
MEKNKRTSEEVLIGFFPNIDQIKLKIILQDDDPNDEKFSSPQRKKKILDDQQFYDTASKFKNTKFYLETENEKIDDMFANKESNYQRAVKKSVTTAFLPNPIAKGFIMPTFLKTNIKRIYALTGKTSSNFSMNRLRLSALKSDNIIFVLYVTGSEDTEYSYKLLTKNFSNISDNHKSVFIYIVPNNHDDSTYNYKNKKDVILNKYLIDMRNLDTDRFFFAPEISRPKEYPNNLSQYYKFCCQIPFSYSLFGFYGLRGPKGDLNELEKNIKFLMKYHKQPFIINKLNLFENKNNIEILSEEKIKSYSWFFVFDTINSNCFRCFTSFSHLIDFSKDRVSGMTLLPPHVLEDNIKPLFTQELNSRGIKKFTYTEEVYESDASAIVKKKINFGSEHYDFVVIYNSINNSDINKVNFKKQDGSNFQIIRECLSNICVNNGM